jgi:signal transduction histidine kinase
VGLALALVSAAWIDPAEWPTYAVFLVLAFAFSFLWLDTDAPTSVAHMAVVRAFVYIAGFPILFFDLLARCIAYPLIFVAARRGLIALPRPFRPLAQAERVAAQTARLDLGAIFGLATIGLAVRVAVVHIAGAAGVPSLIWMVVLGEPIAFATMALLSAWLPLPPVPYLIPAFRRLPVDDERIDVIFAVGTTMPFLALLIVYGWDQYGLIGAATWSVTTLPPHALVHLLVRRRRLLEERRAALERANATLERKQQEIEEFAYTVAHDLKAPLSAIGMTADGVLETNLSDAARTAVARIVRLAGDTEDMIVGLLGVVRIVSEPEPVAMVDLGDVTAEALDTLQPHLAARGVVVDVTTPLPSILGQATKLRHVVANLLGNAIRFVPEGSGRIDIRAAREGASVVLAVHDNGIGIAAEYHRAIFEMFRRVPNGDGQHAGTGMGLALVKRIVETHGGQVWVESTPGAGSVFRVRLPAG